MKSFQDFVICSLVDVVLSDLKFLKPIAEDDAKGFINMVDKVERCWLDLDKMSMSSEMSCANVVSSIEKVLPATQKREWVILAESISDHTRLFPRLLEFLLKEKRVLEYINSSVRMNKSNVKASVHIADVCQEDLVRGSSSSLVMDAIHKMEQRHEKLENDVSNLTCIMANLTSSKAGLSKTSVGSQNKCWLHSTDAHDIQDCRTFRDMSSNDKLEMIRKRGICFSCLKGFHISRNCNSSKACE